MTQPLYSNRGFQQMLEISEGSTFPLEIRLSDPSDPSGDTPYDLSGCEVRARVQRVRGPVPNGGYEGYDFEFSIDDPASGIARGFLTPAQTKAMDANDAKMQTPVYAWACEVKLADGTIVPFCHGDVLVRTGIINWN